MNDAVEPTDELRAVLAAYRLVKDASWPQLHAAMAQRAAHWPFATESDLRAELERYLVEASSPDCSVRVFWKIGPQYRFAGCNGHFARDAGLARAELVGLDDFDARLPWQAQAAKYRADDQDVVRSGKASLDILERQTSLAGTTLWVRVGKAPVRTASGAAIGVFGMYELLDDKSGQRLYIERSKGRPGA